MRNRIFTFALAFTVVSAVNEGTARAQYAVDAAHSSVYFKASHLGLSWVYGRFNDVAGTFSIDPDPSKSSFELTIKAESVDTNNQKRDEHLRGPDFFNAKQFPTLSFKSTAVKAVKDGLEVTGNFTMHGQTKPLTFTLLGGKTAQFPKGVDRIGYSTELNLKRSDFGMDKFLEMIGDEVHIAVSFEGTKK
jgi:polyisoprenoid-binding protein YceI